MLVPEPLASSAAGRAGLERRRGLFLFGALLLVLSKEDEYTQPETLSFIVYPRS